MRIARHRYCRCLFREARFFVRKQLEGHVQQFGQLVSTTKNVRSKADDQYRGYVQHSCEGTTD